MEHFHLRTGKMCVYFTKITLDLRSNKLLVMRSLKISSFNTPVTNIFNNDYIDLKNKKITKSKFIKKYGHLSHQHMI